MWFEGALSVKAALQGNHRKVQRVLLDQKKKDHDTSFIIRLAKEKKVPVEELPRETLDTIAQGKTYGGVLGEVGPRIWDSLDSVFTPVPFIVVLEGVEDPFNLGYAIRTLYAAGCSGLLLPTRQWEEKESVIAKSSAGAFEHLPIVLVDDFEKPLQVAKEKGCKVYAAMRKEAIPYFEAELTQPLVLCLGGEMRGLSAKTLAQCEQNLMIPYANDFRNALNAAGAVAAMSFEVVRQRAYNK